MSRSTFKRRDETWVTDGRISSRAIFPIGERQVGRVVSETGFRLSAAAEGFHSLIAPRQRIRFKSFKYVLE